VEVGRPCGDDDEEEDNNCGKAKEYFLYRNDINVCRGFIVSYSRRTKAARKDIILEIF
jgi:hypothetical protein